MTKEELMRKTILWLHKASESYRPIEAGDLSRYTVDSQVGVDACLEHGFVILANEETYVGRQEYRPRHEFRVTPVGLVFANTAEPFVIAEVKLIFDPKQEGRRTDNTDERLEFVSVDGRSVKLDLSGDCCSGSYFEETCISEAKELVGQTITRIQHVESELPEREEPHGNVTKYHAVKISTLSGELVLDWRNESNGYYDGSCEVAGWVMG